MIITISGRSGSGQSTLLRKLLSAIPGAYPLQSTTTRPTHERDTIPGEYQFMSAVAFTILSTKGAFMWCDEPNKLGYRYGTSKTKVLPALKEGVACACLTLMAVKILHEHASKHPDANVRSIFLHTDDEELIRARLSQRDKTHTEEIERRIVAGRDVNGEALALRPPLYFINARWEPDEILTKALVYLGPDLGPANIPPH